LQFARVLWPGKFSRRTVILLVMQTLDNKMRLKPKRSLFGRGNPGLTTEQDPETPNPTYIEVAGFAAQRVAEKLKGIARIGTTEALFDVPVTAHIMGGAAMGDSPETGVIDAQHRVYGYENLLVCDGAVIPANLGVNPSLTITAMAEYAMSQVLPKPDATVGRPALRTP
jgi:cholesterol oxidase